MLARKTGVFSASAEHVAPYCAVERKTVLRALDELRDAGWFELQRSEPFKPNVYRIVEHKEWAKRHPGQCVVKDVMPWDGEGDALGRQLFAISGQRVTFFPNQATGLRALGFSDERIIEAFRTFIDGADYKGKEWKHASFDFHAHLKTLAASLSKTPVADADVRDSRGAEYHGRYSDGVPPKALDRVPSESAVEYHGRDASSRYESPKGVFEGEKSIPDVPPLASPPPLKPTSEEERRRLLEKQKVLILKKYPVPVAKGVR
jgi:hypothetical protein